MSRLFSVTLFASALLLFCVQPMIAKMILPLLGGSPAVWNTCMVFFQAALLGGYLYAHGLTTYVPGRSQQVVHVLLLCLPFLVLPIGITAAWADTVPQQDDPVSWLLKLLLLVVGLPFFVVASSAPLLQKWFAGSGHPDAADPYFLYAASNLGSMAALLGYPVLLEPYLPLAAQSLGWTAGYAVLVALTAACAAAIWRARPELAVATPEGAVMTAAAPEEASTPAEAAPRWKKKTAETAAADEGTPPPERSETVTFGRRCRWIALAAVPSTLMLAVTAYITTDLAAVPLLWLMPLAVYLLSFILVFAQRQWIPHAVMVSSLPIATLVVVFAFLTGVALAGWFLVPLHWLVLFIASMVCHGELARDRPSPRYLTEFYLWMSFGGVVGGLLAALVAPLVFRIGILEYPLALIAACLLRPGPSLWQSPSVQRWLDLLTPLGVLTVTLAAALFVGRKAPPSSLEVSLALAILIFLCFMQQERPIRFAMSVLALFLGFTAANPTESRLLFVERNFFGVVRVHDEPGRPFRQLLHGSTMHGVQQLTADGQPDPQPTALSYYFPSGPMGQIFNDVYNPRAGKSVPAKVGVTGLGVGGLAAYGQPGQHWTYYEIDPAVARVANDPRFFTYLTAARQKNCPVDVLLGDARLRLREAAPHGYGLIVQDAFSSDSVPAHLMSREALQLYLSKLAPEGILVFNISNRYLDLKPVLANLAADADPPLVCYSRDDVTITQEELDLGKTGSMWVVMARKPEYLGPIPNDERWKKLEGQPGARVWTDDYSNLLSVLKWR
ncbi:MAG: fused MFS/spermidine synthase [Planctomycetia bacterium]|nr:fused MFS/spermidine synthase [Planctomycetia bacterium]